MQKYSCWTLSNPHTTCLSLYAQITPESLGNTHPYVLHTHGYYLPLQRASLGPAMEPLQLSTNLASCYNTAPEPEEYQLQFCVCHLSK